jgi:hypothetical protein
LIERAFHAAKSGLVQEQELIVPTREKVIHVKLSDGTEVAVCATMLNPEQPVAALDRVLPFTQITQIITGVANEIATALRSVKPDKASVEFGIEVAIETGTLTALLVQGTTTANLKITLEWSEK